MQNLGEVERKLLGALLMMADSNGLVNAFMYEVANKMGYKTSGGQVTMALKSLEMKDYVVLMRESSTKERAVYKVLI